MIKVGVIGGTGYTGVELLRLSAVHPQVELRVITSRAEVGKKAADLFPNLRGHVDLAFTEPDEKALGACDVVFFATPNGVAMQQARALLKGKTRLIDLAADFSYPGRADLGKMVWHAARLPGVARRGGIRPARG